VSVRAVMWAPPCVERGWGARMRVGMILARDGCSMRDEPTFEVSPGALDDGPPARDGQSDMRRVAVWAALLALVGVGGGLIAARAVGRMLALPSDSSTRTYADAGTDTPESTGPVATGDESGGAERAVALPKSSYVDPIVERNIFDSSLVGKPSAAVVGEGTCRSDATVRLMATVVAEPEQFSSALISTGGKDARAIGFAVGDDVAGAGRIARIDFQKVCLDDGSCICLGEASGAPAPGTEAGKPAEGGVEKLSDTKFQVDKSVLDEALGNMESFAGQLRVVPHKDGSGNVDGFRLSAIKKGSMFDKLGIKNGDIVHAVNGKPLTSTEGALSTYQTLRNERSFTFEISRRSQRQTLEYEVR
jgi:general secretion pathway protein C